MLCSALYFLLIYCITLYIITKCIYIVLLQYAIFIHDFPNICYNIKYNINTNKCNVLLQCYIYVLYILFIYHFINYEYTILSQYFFYNMLYFLLIYFITLYIITKCIYIILLQYAIFIHDFPNICYIIKYNIIFFFFYNVILKTCRKTVNRWVCYWWSVQWCVLPW